MQYFTNTHIVYIIYYNIYIIAIPIYLYIYVNSNSRINMYILYSYMINI